MNKEKLDLKLFQCKNETGYFHVIAGDYSEAKDVLEKMLNEADHGFTNKRKVTEIKQLDNLVEIDYTGKWNFVQGNRLIIPQEYLK